MKKEFDTLDEVEAFASPMIESGKFTVSVLQLANGKYTAEWMEHKYYTAQDGQTFPDEVWITREGNMVFIQDLEPEHAKNIIRLMMRNDRKVAALADEVREKFAEALLGVMAEADASGPGDNEAPPKSMLH